MDDSDHPARPLLTRKGVLTGFDVAMAVAAAGAIAALSLEHGFYPGQRGGVSLRTLHWVQVGALAVFVLNRFAHLALGARRREFFRQNWIDFALMLVAGGVAGGVYTGRITISILPAATIYVVITQVYILSALVVRTVGFHLRIAESGIHPVWTLIGSFAVVILVGTGLLMLPMAAPIDQPVSLTDALFTATSATCVTGLIVRDTRSVRDQDPETLITRDTRGFAPFGQVVILCLIQLGGLGIMIFGTLFALLAGRALSLRETLLAGQVLSEETVGRAGRMVKFVIGATFALELLGAALMLPTWSARGPSLLQGAFASVFHSVSAFCNAGFCLESKSLVELRGRWVTMGVIAPLIFLGGLGFPVLYDLGRALWHRVAGLFGRRGVAPPIGLHSRLVLTTSLALLLLGALGLWGVETASNPGQTFGSPTMDPRNPQDGPVRASPRHQLAKDSSLRHELSPPGQLREALFQSVTARTAGFNTIDMNALYPAGKFWMCLLMLVGGSPAGTAGGMKTVTLAVLVLAGWGLLRRREQVEGFRRTIALSFVRKALVLAGLYLALVAAVTLLLTVAMTGRRMPDGREVQFIDVFFEACSACGTVGLTCGVTASLSQFGKGIVIAAMFLGRLGPLTVLMALTLRLRPAKFAYPSEEVILG